jgi:hypothetical protein
MLIVFQVLVEKGHDPDALLSAEVLAETKAEVLTLEQAARKGFSGVKADPGGREVRLITVPQHDAQFVQRRLEMSHAVVAFEKHEVDV